MFASHLRSVVDITWRQGSQIFLFTLVRVALIQEKGKIESCFISRRDIGTKAELLSKGPDALPSWRASLDWINCYNRYQQLRDTSILTLLPAILLVFGISRSTHSSTTLCRRNSRLRSSVRISYFREYGIWVVECDFNILLYWNVQMELMNRNFGYKNKFEDIVLFYGIIKS